MEKIKLYWVRTHNLKNIDVEIPKNQITVITWVSGSWKSTLAFNTIYKEGQFRYIESLSTYLRWFFNLGDRPDMDYSEGLSPAIAIEQNKRVWNKRSTVWTLTETDDYLRLAFAKLWEIYCYSCGTHIRSRTIDEIINMIYDDFSYDSKWWQKGKEVKLKNHVESSKNHKDSSVKIWLLSKKMFFEDHKKLEKFFRKNQKEVDRWAWYTQLLVKWKDFSAVYFYLEEPKFKKDMMPVEVYGIYDKITLKESNKYRLQEDLIKLFSSNDEIYVAKYTEDLSNELNLHSYTIYSYCSNCDIHFPEYTPAHFSPNRVEWACPECKWTWQTLQVDFSKIIDENQSVKNAILPWRDSNLWQKILQKLSIEYGFDLEQPWKDLDDEIKDIILNWDGQLLRINLWGKYMSLYYHGVEEIIKDQYERGLLTRDFQAMVNFWTCPKCKWKKLNDFALSVKLWEQMKQPDETRWEENDLKSPFSADITYYQNLTIDELIDELKKLKFSKEKEELKNRIILPLLDKLETIKSLWLGYLSLSRQVDTLSGGEIQRLRLAKQLWNKLSGIIYVLDEPTIWLDTEESLKTIQAIKKLKEMWNTIIVVEHNEDFIKNADYVIEIWPWAGDFWWNIVFSWTINEFLKSNTLTAKYVTWKEKINPVLPERNKDFKQFIEVKKAHKHNLKNVDVKIPLGAFTIITWPSWAGKTTLLYDIIYNFFEKKESITQWYIRMQLMKQWYSWTDIMNKQLINPSDYSKYEKEALTNFFHNELEVDTILWYENVKNYVYIDQSAIWKNPRSCPATFIWVWDDIRELFAQSKEAKMYWMTSSYFSFNSTKWACQECKWYGYKKIELQFLPDTYVECELCHGKRFKPEVLNVYWNGKNVADILDMYVEDALDFFSELPHIREKLQLMVDIWLGYLKMWQPAHTLSGWESQRLKLVKNLLKKYKGHTVYFLDEPTVWLHFVDIEKLLNILWRFLARWDTIIMIEHDKNLLKFADKVIEMRNGEIV